MNAGQRVRIIKFPHLTGTCVNGSYQRTFKDWATDRTFTPPEPRVDIKWDIEHGTPERTTIMEELLEIVNV